MTTNPQRLLTVLKESGPSALNLASSVAGATLAAVLGVVVFVAGFYVFLIHGARFGHWLEKNLPLTASQFRGFSNAFYETGRGLLLEVSPDRLRCKVAVRNRALVVRELWVPCTTLHERPLGH